MVYTLYGNLKKTQGMDVGQVGFHSDKEVPIILYSIVTEIFTFVGEDNKSGEEGKRGGKQVEQDPAGENT